MFNQLYLVFIFAGTFIMIGVLVADIIVNLITWKKLSTINQKINHVMVKSL